MKNFLPFFFLLFLLSCHQESKPPAMKVLNDKDEFLPDSLKQPLLKIIEGGWVNEEYIAAFRKFHSPMIAAGYGLPNQQMAFDISNISGDTVINAMGRLNYHEGERFDVVFYKKTDGKISMRIKEDRNYVTDPLLLNYAIEGSDTILLLTITEGKSTFTARFRRQFRDFPENDEVHLTALEYFINQNLFSGNWKMNGQTITFSDNGKITNFKNYQKFSVSSVEENASSRPDEISFYNDTAGVTYAFTIDNKRMQLYEIKESEDGYKFSRGKLIGELEKQ